MNDSIASIQDKVILITGAAQGIGEATARLCAARGAQVLLADVQQERGESVADAIRSEGGRATFHAADMRSEDAVRALFDHVRSEHGRLDVLICAAGVLQGQYVQPEELPLETFQFVLDVNVTGTFLCAKYATPLLLEADKGVLILIASGAGVLGGSSSIAYGTSKGAVNGMGMVLAQYLEPRGVRVNTVCPGGLATGMKLSVMQRRAELDGETFDPEAATAKLGDPAGVARLLAYLSSDDAEYVRRNMFTR